jgi:hypothetical protein
MFVRFRETKTRLQLSLVENRRANGKVRHEHVASLGSVEMPPSVEARITFWTRLHERLGKLNNRVDATTQAKILGDVHARVPMVTPEEQQTLKLENAEADERFWMGLRGMHEAHVEDHKSLGAVTERAIASSKAGAAEASTKAAAAKERADRIRRGEDVPGGLGKPLTREDFDRILRKEGGDPEHCTRLADVCKELGFETVFNMIYARKDRAERAIIRSLHRLLISQDEEQD